jgi:two-component system chemotaxis response regulator CheY
VDDAKIMRLSLTKMLEEAGHTVIGEARDGQQAYDAYSAQHPDLVTMDITMEGVDGVTAVKNIMADFPDARIIMVSSHGEKDLVIEAISNGAAHYILKPVKAEVLQEAIEKVLG